MGTNTRGSLEVLVTAALLGMSLATVSCMPLPLETAYADQRPICSDPSGVFDELVEDCRARWEADESCAGVLGFEGTLEGTAVIVESELSITEFDQYQTLAGPILREDFTVTGGAPYFVFSLQFKHTGGPTDDPAAFPRTQLLHGPEDDLYDDRFSAAFRLSTGAESDDRNATDGQLTTTLQTLDEQAGEFVLEFGKGEQITGCFHAFATHYGYSMEK